MANRTDAALGLLFLALSGAVYALTRGMPPGTLEDGMGSAFFPLCVAAVLAALSLGLIAAGIFGKKPRTGVPGGEEPGFPLLGPHLRLPAALTLTVALYLSVLEALGFLLATPLFVLAAMKLFRSGWMRAALAGMSTTAGLYVIFQLGLRIPFPAGLLLGF